MFLGHAFAAFALAVVLARLAGQDDATAFSLGLVASASAFLPDLDLVVGAISYLSLLGGQVGASWEGLWGTSNAIHRGLSHTLLGGAGIAAIVTGVATSCRKRRASRTGASLGALAVVIVATVGLGAISWKAGGMRDAISIGVVLAGAVALGGAVATRTQLRGPFLLAGALVGLLFHPFTDVFMATPPRIFYPFDAAFLTESVRLAADPTINLVTVALVELGAIWAGVLAFASVQRLQVRRLISSWAGLGLLYPIVMVAVPRPTMADAHLLGFTLVPFGLVGVLGVVGRDPRRSATAFRAAGTALATVTIATVAYLLAYGVVFRV